MKLQTEHALNMLCMLYYSLLTVQRNGGIDEDRLRAAAEHGDVSVGDAVAHDVALVGAAAGGDDPRPAVVGMLVEVWARDVVEFCWK